ncbi:MAG: hypothetical protein CVU51_09805 [Deltaproteobacteria bacterium HGW-Deltaproteobacteria-1]|nr:MAG: hypothetical protein CVU51_09805 [Deltaproteobacteria bacterium HGW-Deltaproteobacteria-1]
MSTNSSKFLIGLFVIIGLMLLSATIIWVGASRILMKGSLYAVYFDESVQGLQVDSAIKYRGVEIGTVQSIGVAPDYRLIEVIMKIDLESNMEHQTIASLKTAGITGIVFIELDRIAEGELSGSPKLSFKSDYPVIPSRWPIWNPPPPIWIRQLPVSIKRLARARWIRPSRKPSAYCPMPAI